MPSALDRSPTKIIAVHLNYRSRAGQRGRTPTYPSYFLKPPSSLAASGTPLVRPLGCELLAFEGEIALVVGERTRGISPDEGWSRVRFVAAANDAALYDLRYCDRGSNLRYKGSDGLTPLSTDVLDASGLEPGSLQIRTWLNDELVQEDWTDGVFFDFGFLVADLSRTITLEPGDVILTGTPAGASTAEPGDTVTVEVSAVKTPDRAVRVTNPVLASSEPLPQFGAQPRCDDALRADARGGPQDQMPALPAGVVEQLRQVSTATLTAQLAKRGLRNVTVDGVGSSRPDLKLVGRARTLRYLPVREDLVATYAGPMNAQKASIEALEPGDVLVMEARGVEEAGTVGDILALRAQVRGAVGIVSDGGLRDSVPVKALTIPIYSRAAHPSALGRRHMPFEVDGTITCGGTVVQPGDVVVGDADGVVVVPRALVTELAPLALDQELQEQFIADQVRNGASVEGLYPLGPAWRGHFDDWLRAGAPRS
ncbi:MAG: fumarylacetoacetate hydrolase family protein [Acidimicrobiales bacterium]